MSELSREQLIEWRWFLRTAAFQVDGISDPDDDRSKETDALCDMALAYISSKAGREGAMVEGAAIMREQIRQALDIYLEGLFNVSTESIIRASLDYDGDTQPTHWKPEPAPPQGADRGAQD